MKWIGNFGRFWYDFVVGDDWTIAVAVVVAVSLTAVLAHNGWNAWPVLPLCVAGALGASLWRALRVHRREAGGPA
jgi:O-antigen ligase